MINCFQQFPKSCFSKEGYYIQIPMLIPLLPLSVLCIPSGSGTEFSENFETWMEGFDSDGCRAKATTDAFICLRSFSPFPEKKNENLTSRHLFAWSEEMRWIYNFKQTFYVEFEGLCYYTAILFLSQWIFCYQNPFLCSFFNKKHLDTDKMKLLES